MHFKVEKKVDQEWKALDGKKLAYSNALSKLNPIN